MVRSLPLRFLQRVLLIPVADLHRFRVEGPQPVNRLNDGRLVQKSDAQVIAGVLIRAGAFHQFFEQPFLHPHIAQGRQRQKFLAQLS